MNNNWEFNHSGVFARGLGHTVRYYQSLGLAPVLPPPPQNQSMPRGNAVNVEFGKVMVNKPDPGEESFLQLIYIGNLEFEVLHAPAERPRSEALAYGEGINHFCFSVPDIDRETDKLVKKGLRIIQDFKLDGKRLEDYLDTREHGNVLLSFRTPMTEEAKARKASVGIVNWKFRGHTAVVKDVDKVAEYYQYLEIAEVGPPAVFDSGSVKDIQVYCKTPGAAIRAKTRTARIASLECELVQPLEGDDIYRESLERRGEGIIDITFTVDDLAKETAMMVQKGIPVIFSGQPQNSGAFACFDTRKDGGDAMIKLVQR